FAFPTEENLHCIFFGHWNLEFGILVTLWFQQVWNSLKPTSVTMEFGICDLEFKSYERTI
ncbi:MAG: hypothetical protein NTW95_02270, partial [Candidatus Aminicenantes bacterium]|nr:hypothetical protein [Candidatus Aminicenantes bacterium]